MQLSRDISKQHLAHLLHSRQDKANSLLEQGDVPPVSEKVEPLPNLLGIQKRDLQEPSTHKFIEAALRSGNPVLDHPSLHLWCYHL